MVFEKTTFVKLSTAALRHAGAASGARYVKPGFAVTSEMDLAFALGYPHLIYLVDSHPADDDPLGAGLAFIDEQGISARVWPREIASRAARSFVFLPDRDDDRREAFSHGGPVTEEEARDIIERWLDCNHGDLLLLLLEALVGPDIVCEAAITTMEGYGEEQWTSVDLTKAPYELGFLVMRLPSASSESARARLEVLLENVRRAGWQSKAARYLDCALHGIEGVERSAYRPDGKYISPTFLTHVVDHPAWVAKAVLAGGPPDESIYPDPRLSFLGGDEVLEAECSWWNKYTRPGSHAIFVERFGHIRSEKLLPVFLEMTYKSKAKKEALAWFAAHADFARGFLERQARGADEAARNVLEAIGG